MVLTAIHTFQQLPYCLLSVVLRALRVSVVTLFYHHYLLYQFK